MMRELNDPKYIGEFLQETTIIDGFAVGYGGTPGRFFTFAKKHLENPVEEIKKYIENLSSPAAKLMSFLLQIKTNTEKNIPIPWELLKDTRILRCQSFGCSIEYVTFNEIIWQHLIDKNYLGLFQHETQQKVDSETGIRIFSEIPLFSPDILKGIAYKLLSMGACTSFYWEIKNWLSGEDISGRLENERELFFKELYGYSIGLSKIDVFKALGHFCFNKTNPEVIHRALIAEYCSINAQIGNKREIIADNFFSDDNDLAFFTSLLYSPSNESLRFIEKELVKFDLSGLGLEKNLLQEIINSESISLMLQKGNNEEQILKILRPLLLSGHPLILNRIQDMIGYPSFREHPKFGPIIVQGLLNLWDRRNEFLNPANTFSDFQFKLNFLLNSGYSSDFKSFWPETSIQQFRAQINGKNDT
jgi:hypothetical protein